MRTEIDKAQLCKLPKWAQDHIQTLARERDIAVRALNEYCDNQTPAPFYADEIECTGEEIGPSTKRRYFQGSRITVEHAGINLDIAICYGRHISLQWSGQHRGLSDIGLIPESFCKAKLVTKEYMK